MSQTQDVFGSAPKSVLNKPYMHVQDQKPTSTGGGTSSTGDNDRTLNTVVVNEIVGASLAANEVSLPAGKYYVEGLAQCGGTAEANARWRAYIKDAAGTKLLTGLEEAGPNTGGGHHSCNVYGEITLAVPTNIKIVTYHNGGVADGLGTALGQAPHEVYADLRIWKLDSNVETPVIADPTMTLVRPLLHVQDQKTSGTNGGTSTTGLNDRELNAVLVNEISGASLSADQVTLPAGEYFIEGESSGVLNAAAGGGLQAFIRNTADTVLITGKNCRVGYQGGTALVSGRIVLSGTDTIKLTTYISTGQATNGLGAETGAGPYEVYSSLKIWQLDAVRKLPVVGEVPLESFVSVDLTGLTTVDLDASLYDTFELHSIDTPTAITVINMDPGRTIIINLSNGAAANPTVTNTIKYTDGTAPEWTSGDDTVVLTKLSTDIVGAFNLNQV